MSTPVSELNARMSLDISQLEQAVPRAIGWMKRLSSAQAEAYVAQPGGPDLSRLEGLKNQLKQPGVVGTPYGTARFKTPQAEATFVEPISQANEESLIRNARRRKAILDEQAIAIASNAKLEAEQAAKQQAAALETMRIYATVEAVRRNQIDQTIAKMEEANAEVVRYQNTVRNSAAESAAFLVPAVDTQVVEELRQQIAAYDQVQQTAVTVEAVRRNQIDQTIAKMEEANAEVVRYQNTVRNSAAESAAAFNREFAALEQVADIRRQQAQVKAQGEYSRANPFQQQVIEVQRLNQLLAQRRQLLSGGDSVAIARATLAVQRQIEAVRNLRESLTVGTETFRRFGNTAADNLGGYARFGLAIQQVGYQVQDFAVQIASGTNAMVALSQQGSQLLGFFGGFYGAVAGAALSVGILVYRLASSEESIKKQAEALDLLSEAFRKYKQSDKEFSRRDLSQPKLAEALTKDAEAAKKASIDASKAVTEARKKISEVDLPEFSKSLVKGGSIYKEDLRYLLNYFYLLVNGATNAQQGTEQFKEASKRFSEALADETQKTQEATRAIEEYDKALKQAKEQGADAPRTDLQRIAFLKQQQAEAEKQGLQNTLEYQTRKNQIEELERTQKASIERLSRDRQLIGKDEFDKLAIYRREWLKSEEGSVAEAEALNRVKEQEQAFKKTADAYKDQLDPLRAQKRELELIDNLINTQVDGVALLTEQEGQLLRMRAQDVIDRTIKMPEVFRIDTGASFAGLRNTDQSSTELISLQQQMLAALRTLVYQGAN